MPLLRGDIDPHHGPILPVTVGLDRQVSALYEKSGRQVPAPVRGYALLDTGASRSGVDQELATQLGLNPVGAAELHTPSGQPMRMGVFFGEVAFGRPELPALRQEFIGMSLRYTVTDGGLLVAILGRDFLAGSTLTYDGLHRAFSLDWQPQGRVDGQSAPVLPGWPTLI